MATGFTRTMRTLERDSFRGSALASGVAAVLFGAWIVWCMTARVALYETTSTARIETDRAASPIQAPIAGRITESRLVIGREVAAGELLIQLDATGKNLQLGERRTAILALEQEIEKLRAQIASEKSARGEERRASSAAGDEARAGEREAEAPASYNAADLSRLQKLLEYGLISERDYQKGKAAVEQSRATVERQRSAVTKVEREQRVRDGERETRIRKLETDVAHLDGEVSSNLAAMETLKNEIARYAIRAPASGRVAESAVLRPGSVVAEGDKLGAIVPDGNVQIVAQFAPASIGRIAAGQHAAMRLDGFSWSQYGAVPAVVSRVGRELRDGSVRVELSLDANHASRVPLGHGLPGTLEIEVERTTPAALILRHAGRMVSQ
jgi:multidrug resistance efflux pump